MTTFLLRLRRRGDEMTKPTRKQKLKNGCGLLTNNGRCGKDNYLCSICKAPIQAKKWAKKHHLPTKVELSFKQGQLSQKNKCCVEDCNKKSTHSLGNNLMNSIHFCKEHLDLFQVHLTAREEMFKEQGQLSEQKRISEIIDKMPTHDGYGWWIEKECLKSKIAGDKK